MLLLKLRKTAALLPLLMLNTLLIRFMQEKLGVNIDELLVSQPDTGEQALEIAESLVRSGAIDVLSCRLCSCSGTKSRDSRERWEMRILDCRRA
jgi:hypothetical protein